ncbi:hypothetical protein GUJ93_ZPchr0004g38812 [Zizania palustris]|uniref:BHLH domain-containing protein n=1 Tax=Zizania palustris TaxID=103762 RepID=A0A8J5SDT8_ZIZPA|nr:hypothetical protein GUJ93_ZPchr0004g38812 [Zizania palustris]
MKLLQSLVPGCNKITGKALMLDEIINYVQSLQRQVEMSNVSKASYLCGDPTTAAATATFSYAGEATGDMFDTYNCWDVDLQMVGATGGGINQDGPTTMASPSSSPPPRHALLPSHGFYGK